MDMMSSAEGRARAAADLAKGLIVGEVAIAASPERVFRALASREILNWWVRPGVFNMTEWTGDVRVGGRWRATGTGNGRPFVLEGEFLEIDRPRKLVHTWYFADAIPPTTVTYRLDPMDGGTRLTLQQLGFAAPDWCMNTCIGWETSFERLAELLAPENVPRHE
jgi:uncharacterized protein YndB with AHSA1/START domain